MKLILISVAVACVCSVAAQFESTRPPIPPLPQAWKANFTLDFPGYNYNKENKFEGYMELDNANGGSRFHLQGEEVLPFYLETNIIYVPQIFNSTINLYAWYDQTCWVNNQKVVFAPMHIPENAKWGGNEELDGHQVQMWQWNDQNDNLWIIAVDLDAPHAVRQLSVQGLFYLWITGVFTFTNIKIGTIPASEFKVPSYLQCRWVDYNPIGVDSEEVMKVSSPFDMFSRNTFDGVLKPMLQPRPVRLVEDRRPSALVSATRASPTPPPIPKLKQVFTSNYLVEGSLRYSNLNRVKIANGLLAVDYKNGGGLMTVNTTDTPLLVATNFIVHPHGSLLTAYCFMGNVCFNYDVQKSYLELFPLAIPPRAVYKGKSEVNGDETSVWSWQFDEYYTGNSTYYVRDSDSALVRIGGYLANTFYYSRDTMITFSNITFSVDPSMYRVPKLTCQQIGL